ncbi:unnamed protein product [Rotaria sp. Silwood1]|nr:unnamed protein product [Rotaria sp. Silwood1]
MFVFYKETSQTLKYSPIRKNRNASSLLLSTSLTASAAQHCRCYIHSSSPPYSVLIFSAADILFRLIEGFVGQVEDVQKNCFRQIMSTRQSNQENSSIFDSNRSRRQQPTPSNIPSNQQQEPLNSSPSHSDQASKACCFCWCCCCSCSCLVSWPHHWQPESFEITTNNTSTIDSQMTQVVPEHVARAKVVSGNTNSRKDNSTSQKNRSQRSNSATLSAISVTCDTDISTRTRNNHSQQISTKKSPHLFTTTNNIAASRSTSALTNVSIIPPNSFNNHLQQQQQQQRKTSMSAACEINIIHEKPNIVSSASTMSIPNKHLIKTTTGAVGGTLPSVKSLSIKHKSTSFDDHRSTRGIGKSVLEHLVFVFPENVRRILSGPKNLTVRTDEGRPPVEPIDLGEPPSIDEVKSWSESFDKLMMSPAGRHYFREFLRSEYSEENFLFWMSCESLKNEQNPDIIEEKARLIYEDYISILSPKEVSLDSRVREVINKNMVEPSPHTFDEAQLQIYTLMHRDSYPRFINSHMYRRLLRNEDVKT